MPLQKTAACFLAAVATPFLPRIETALSKITATFLTNARLQIYLTRHQFFREGLIHHLWILLTSEINF